MTRDDIIRMAQEAGWIIRDDLHYMDHQAMQDALIERIERFAALVADAEAKRIHDEGMVTVGHMRERIAAERESCAQVCEGRNRDGDWFAAEIRARSNT